MEIDPERVKELKPAELTKLMHLWPFWARHSQWPPRGDWVTWLLMGGRGSGKTRAGAEWVRGLAASGVGPIALVGETITEAIVVMVEGPSGLLAVTPPERPKNLNRVSYTPEARCCCCSGGSKRTSGMPTRRRRPMSRRPVPLS